DVEHHAVGTLEEDPLAGGERRPQLDSGVGDEGPQALAVLAVAGVDLVDGERRLAEDRLEVPVLLAEVPRERIAESRFVVELADGDPGPRHLVLVGGPDATAGRADLPRAPQPLARAVDRTVIRHDEVRALAHAEPPVLAQVAALAERVDLRREHLGVDDHPRSHHADAAGVEHARGNQVQDRLLPVHDQRVPGVVAAVEADDDVGVRGEEIDDLPLPLVAPLRADDDRRRHPSQRRSCSAATICGSWRSAASVSGGTGSSTWMSDSAMPPTFSRLSSIPAMLIARRPRRVPTAPTTPGTSRLWSMRMCPSGTASIRKSLMRVSRTIPAPKTAPARTVFARDAVRTSTRSAFR